MTAAAVGGEGNLVLVEGMPSGNPNDGHGASDSLTGQGFGYYGQGVIKISVDQFVAKKLAAGGVNRPIASLLLGAQHQRQRRHHAVLRRRERRQPADHRLAAVGVQHRVRRRAAGRARRPSSLLARRKSILDTITAEINGAARRRWAATRRRSSTPTSDSIRQLENKLQRHHADAGGACTKPTAPGADSTYQYMSGLDALAANAIHQQHHRQRLRLRHHPRGLPPVRQRPEADGQRRPACPTTISTAASSTAAPPRNYANLVKFEAYLATQFVNIINLLKSHPGPARFDRRRRCSTGRCWFGRATWATPQNHNQQSMRFVLASGTGGYLKTAANGRYIKSTERHERILLNICEAMGITSYAGFGDPGLTGAAKTPLPGIAA